MNWVIKYGVCFFREVTKFYLNFNIQKLYEPVHVISNNVAF